MKPTLYSYFLLFLLPLVTSGLHATQCQSLRQIPPPSKAKTVTKQEKALAATNKLAGIRVLENLVAIYAGFGIDEILDKAQYMWEQGEEIKKKGEEMENQAKEIFIQGGMLEAKGGQMGQQGANMMGEAEEIYVQAGRIKKKGVKMMDVRKQRLAAIRKMEVYNKDKTSAKIWGMIGEGEAMEKEGRDRRKEGWKMRIGGWRLVMEGYKMKREGIAMRDKGHELLQIKYTTMMQGHESNTNCHWENLGRIVEWLVISD